MIGFWILVIVSIVLVGSIMGLLAWLAREVPDASEKKSDTRLNPDQIRMLAYAIMVLVCLLAAIYELSMWYSG